MRGETAPVRPAEAEEVDLWWGGYSARAMVPTFVLCALLTVAIIVLAGSLWGEAHPQLVWHLSMVSVTCVWIYAVARAAYLMAALNYRLTTRGLYRDRGFYKPADGDIPLIHVRQVLVERNAVEHVLGLGKVRVLGDDGRAIIFEGLLHPENVAADIRQAVEQARKHA